MGEKGSKKKAANVTSGSQSSTLREESSGKKQTKTNAKSMLKLEHIKNLAVWASGEAAIPSLFPCHRCESILQPGYNCTVQIEKNRTKVQNRRKKPSTSTQNNVVYKCHFCFHGNIKRGTPRGHMKEIRPGKAKLPSKSEPADSADHTPTSSELVTNDNVDVNKVNGNVDFNKMDDVALPEIAKDDSATGTLAAPSTTRGLTLLEAKCRKRNKPGSEKAAEPESSPATTDAEKALSTSNKRKRKSWTSLKEIAGSREHDSNLISPT